MKKGVKKIVLASLFLLTAKYSCLFSQDTGLEKLSNYNTTWTSVLPGTTLCEPEVTSYGFCLATDARNLMGFSSEGKLLWEKNIGRVRKISLTALRGDFILFHDQNSNIIKLFNPSGSEIWSKSLDFKPAAKPFAGRDGRFFIHGDGNVVCYGINGIIRWKIKTGTQKALPIQELPDGSIIVFLADQGGKTKGLRLSPFGEQLEDITFAASIKQAFTCSEGVLLIFTDGSAGLFSVTDGLTQSRWVTSVKAGNPMFVVNHDRTDFRLLSLCGSDVTVYKLNAKDGSEAASWKIPGLNGNSLLKTDFSDTGLFLADSVTAVLIDSDGKELWAAKMPDTVRNKTVNQIIYLKDNYLVFCSKNWSMNAYHTSQSTSKYNGGQTVQKNIQADYSSFAPVDLSEINYYSQGGFYSSIKNSDREAKIKSGNYGVSEKEWLTQTLSIARLYYLDSTSSDFGVRMEKSVFSTDSAGFEAILVQLALLCTDNTQAACADIISRSNNKFYCRAIMANLSGYDPDGKLLSAIEKNAELAGNKDSVYCNIICDAVYSICLFMGRPAYNKKGKDIIKRFMGANYTSNTRTYARDTLKKIISLEL